MKKLSKALFFIVLVMLIAVLVACEPPVETHQHNLRSVKGREATCILEGLTAYWRCTDCGKYFSDQEATNEITPESTIIPKSAHTPIKHDAQNATCLASGNLEYYSCSKCDKYFSDQGMTTEITLDDVATNMLGHDFSARHEDSLSYWFCCSRCGALQENSRKPLDANFTLPDLSEIWSTTYEIGVGQRYDFAVPDTYGYTAYSWDTNIVKIEDYFDYGFVRGFYVCGMSEGEVIVSVVNAEGETIRNIKIVVHQDELLHMGEGTLVESIDIANTDATVYYDDTTVTYTIKTSASVDRLDFAQIMPQNTVLEGYYFDSLIELDTPDSKKIFTLDTLSIGLDNLSDTFIGRDHGVRYSATRTVSGDEATWIVKWDLGATGVKYVRIVAQNTITGKKQTSYAHLNIVYPKFGSTDADFADLVNLFVKTNSTSAILFQSTKEYTIDDQGAETFVEQDDLFKGIGTNFSERFANTTLFGGNSITHMTTYGMTTEITLSSMHVIEELCRGKNVLCGLPGVNNTTMAFFYPITDEMRAVLAYQNGYEIDEEKFPYAHFILQKASAILDEIITEDMDDFQKERAIYTWIYQWGAGLQSGEIQQVDVPDGLDDYTALKTSYGLFKQYGGDCMAYSGAFYTLCNMAGVDCVTVALNSQRVGGPAAQMSADHRANVVKLGDEYYFVETFWTWQTTSETDGVYRYLNMTSQKAATIYGWALEENGGPSEFSYTTYIVDEQTGELVNK